jgi:mannose-6-phosphate isomerase
LSTTPDSRIALGLTKRLTPDELRRAIESGAIADLVDWRAVQAGETILVPAGTIHALGAGLAVAEIQQNSDATFRMFDYGRDRPLDVDSAVAVAVTTPFIDYPAPQALSAGRTLLITSPYFVLEQIDLPHGTDWHLHARSETWAMLLKGCARLGSMDVSAGEAVFLDRADTDLKVGPDGLRGLLAYVATEPILDLLRPQFDMD